ncbi:MAG: zinc-binding alcohol dehydrogenase family protein [Clostridiales bacterium]|nr:zinc-binding alcohol dehydrogenase family protein [Clostridiales bacterium]
MKAIYMKEPYSIEVAEIEKSKPAENEALIRIKSAGICGSDIGAFRGTNSLVSYPRIIGHELGGEILELPKNDTSGLKIGDRVVVDPYLYCGICYPCSIGRTNCCTDLKVLGVHIDGGMSEYFSHPVDMLVKVPDNMPWDIVPLAEPLTIALHGLHRLKLTGKEHIVIFGAGSIGLLAAMSAIHYGATPILVDLIQERLDLAKTLGVIKTVNIKEDNLIEKIHDYTNGRMAECVMEASGSNEAIRSALDIVSHAGRIAFTGWPKDETLIPTAVITKKEIDIRGARTSAGEFDEAIDLIYNDKVEVQRIVTKTVSIDDVPETIRDIDKNPNNYIKVNVIF